MVYFKINDTDYSMYTAGLKITNASNYTSQTNAHYDTVVDYINDKKTIEVEIIPLDEIDEEPVYSSNSEKEKHIINNETQKELSPTSSQPVNKNKSSDKTP